MTLQRIVNGIVPLFALACLVPATSNAQDPTTIVPGNSYQVPAGSTQAPSITPKGPTTVLPETWTHVSGKIQAVDIPNQQVKIQDEAGTLSQVMVDSSVTIKRDGKSVSLAQLKPGDYVSLTRKRIKPDNSNKG